jgi:hypothetical protein
MEKLAGLFRHRTSSRSSASFSSNICAGTAAEAEGQTCPQVAQELKILPV